MYILCVRPYHKLLYMRITTIPSPSWIVLLKMVTQMNFIVMFARNKETLKNVFATVV